MSLKIFSLCCTLKKAIYYVSIMNYEYTGSIFKVKPSCASLANNIMSKKLIRKLLKSIMDKYNSSIPYTMKVSLRKSFAVV